ncbi:MAG: hypothetical protein M1114_02355 [Candidatus Dependentiae bacterium]|nr:hypothetical protein [Candidatus Dependentiae bacterium]
MKFAYIFLFLMLDVYASERVLIITHAHSRPDFIELQEKTFRIFLKDTYEYVVFNDAPNDNMCRKIENTCRKLNIRCFRIPPEMHNGRQTPNYRHVDGIQFSLETLGFDHDGIVLMLDSDMFLVKPFSVNEYMGDYDFIGFEQERVDGARKVFYSGPHLVFMNMKTLPNKRTLSFEGDRVEGLACDVGGHSYYYFVNNPSIRIKLASCISTTPLLSKAIEEIRSLGFDEQEIAFIFKLGKTYGMEFHGNKHFIHFYAGGSNWPGYSATYLKEKTRLLNQHIDQCILKYRN